MRDITTSGLLFSSLTTHNALHECQGSGARCATTVFRWRKMPSRRQAQRSVIRSGNGPGPFKRCPSRSRSLPLLAAAAIATQLSVSAVPALAQQEILSVAEATAVEQKVEQESAGININSASSVELAERLNGVGASKAEAIVRYREQFGPFESVEELSEVTGIGAATVERNRQLLRVR